MDVPVRFIDSIINNPLLMQFLVHRWFFLLEYDPRLDQLRVCDTRSRTLETLDAYLGSEKPEHATIFAEDRWKMRALLTGELYGPLEMRFVSPEGMYYSREVDARRSRTPPAARSMWATQRTSPTRRIRPRSCWSRPATIP